MPVVAEKVAAADPHDPAGADRMKRSASAFCSQFK
jgi:hypothetical protein